MPDLDAIRRRFPSLQAGTVMLENAGGSQVPRAVADAIRDYMLTSYVQLGAGYPEADRADAVVDGAHGFVNRLVNGEGQGQAILGPSTSQLVAMLAGAYGATLQPGDEVVIMEAGHEANVGPWARLAQQGAVVKTWKVDPATGESRLEDLEALLGPRTRLVAVVHVSNLLGGVEDVAAISRRVHDRSPAHVIADGVAYAPHRAVDVRRLGVDWYAYSAYKVYGPHMGVLWGRNEALAEVTGPNHFFIPRDDVPHAFELGGVCHEGCAGLLALRGYLSWLAGGAEQAPEDPFAWPERSAVERAFDAMAACEAPLQRELLGFLSDRPGVRVIGPADGPDRVPTVSFVHESIPSAELVSVAHAAGVGIRNGHMYAHRLVEAMGLDLEDGVVRVSAVHYNTPEEIDRLLGALATRI